MAEHFDYQANSRTPSLARPSEGLPSSFTRTNRYSHHSVAPSTRTWVTSTQQNPPGPPPPQPVNLPSPVQTLRPLPTLRAQGPLHVVNNSGPLNLDDDQGFAGDAEMDPVYQPRRFEHQPSAFDPSFGAIRPRKKKSFVGGFVKGIRKLPRAVFGYGAGAGQSDTGKSSKRRGTLETEGTATGSVTGMSTGNTLPLYTSNPPTPVVTGPVPPGLSVYHRPHMVMSEPTIPESPLPSVVRLDDHKRHNPSFRVSPPFEEIQREETGQLFATDGEPYFEHSVSDGLPSNPADRTTVMLYNERETQYYGRNSHVPAPPPVVARQLSSPGLSYVSSEPLAPVRPTSFHSTHPHVPTPIEIPQTVPPTSTPGPRVSYASQAPTPRATPPSLIPGAVHSSPTPHLAQLSQAQTADPQTSQHADPAAVPSSEPIQSPVSVHPTPGADYMKMTLSPTPTSHATVTSGTSYYDPSFSSDLNPVEKFFKTLYHMPWVSHDRVTVDYLPGEGLGKMKKKKFRPATSWYHSILSRSRRSNASLDLLSSGTGTEASPRHSLGMSVALALGSPLSGSRRSKTASDKHRSAHNKSRHQSSSRRRGHGHHSHHTSSSHKRRRHTATTMDSTDTGANHPKRADTKPASSPLIPSVYPFQYPPYPYSAFPTFPMPLPVPASAPGVLSGHDPNQQPPQVALRIGERPAVPRGPRGEQQQQPMLYAPAGYALNSYQPMMAAPQVYVLSSPTQMHAAILPALGPSPDGNNGAGTGTGQQTSVASQGQQPLSNHSGMMFMQTIPGAFS